MPPESIPLERGGRSRRGFRPLRDAPTGLWLLAAVVVAIGHDAFPAPRWLIIHVLLLGAASHSVVVWSQHFADALLKTRPTDDVASRLGLRLAALNVGAVLVVVGVAAKWWVVIVVGAAAVTAAAVLHAVALARQRRRSLPARFSATVRFYVAAAALLPFGVTAGVLLTRDLSDSLHERLHVAHLTLNVLGWIGITVLGTLVTLWPTILATQIDPRWTAASLRSLPLLVGGVAVAAAGAVAGVHPMVTVGLMSYAVGALIIARSVLGYARVKPPVTYAAQSMAAGVAWWVLSLGFLVVQSSRATTWDGFAGSLDAVAPYLAAGFVAQVLLGALSYLVPTVLGGGPARSRLSHREFDRGGPLRIAVINAGLVVTLVPVSTSVRTAVGACVVAALAAFLILLARATIAWRRGVDVGANGANPVEAVSWHSRPRGQRSRLAVAGLVIVALAIVVGLAA